MIPADETLDNIDARMASAHLRQRREVRYSIALEIEVSGLRNGEVFHERTFTQNVSDWGCGFWMVLELKPEDLVMVRRTDRDPGQTSQPSQSLFQVMRVVSNGDRWLVGAWKMDAANVWGTDLEKLAHAQEDGLELRRPELVKG